MRTIAALLRTVRVGWQAATPRHFAYTFVVALAWGFVTIASATAFFAGPVPAGPAINALLSMQLNGLAVLLAVLVADQVASPSERRAWPYALAVTVGVAIGTTLTWALSQRILGLGTAYGAGNHESFQSFGLRHGRHALVVCGMVTFVYVSARWAAERRAALRGLQLECVAAEKQLVEATLTATQARVDPAALQEALVVIDRLYDTRPDEADARLRDLIASLRAAIPPNPDNVPLLASATRRTA